MAASRQRQNSRQKRGHSAIVYADQDYYSVLGISKNADKAAIKSAYRQKARKFHPDVNKEPGAEDTFKAVSNAYEVLSDDQKRGIYDRYSKLPAADAVPSMYLHHASVQAGHWVKLQQSVFHPRLFRSFIQYTGIRPHS